MNLLVVLVNKIRIQIVRWTLVLRPDIVLVPRF
jgi:hypothetical protein